MEYKALWVSYEIHRQVKAKAAANGFTIDQYLKTLVENDI